MIITIVIVLCAFFANNNIVTSGFIVHQQQNIRDNQQDNLQGTSQHFFPSFSYFPFGGHNNNFIRSSNHRLFEPIFRRNTAKNARHLFDYRYNDDNDQPQHYFRQNLDRSDESSSIPLDQSPSSVSIMRGGTFFEDGQSNEDVRYNKFNINADRDKQEYFSNEAESHSKPVYQQFDGFRDFADITLPTSSQLLYAQISDRNTNFNNINGQMMESNSNVMEYLKESKLKTKLESENRKSLIKEMKKKKKILNLPKQLLYNNGSNSDNFEPLLAVN